MSDVGKKNPRQSKAWEGGAGPTWSSRVESGSNTPAGDKHMTWNSILDRFNFHTFLWAPTFFSLQRTGNDRFLQIIPLVTLSVVNMMPCSPCCTQGSIRSSIRLTSDPRFLILMTTTKHWFLHLCAYFFLKNKDITKDDHFLKVNDIKLTLNYLKKEHYWFFNLNHHHQKWITIFTKCSNW